jgi:hypothetical protein
MEITIKNNGYVHIKQETLNRILEDAAQSSAMLDWIESEWQQRLGCGPAHRLACDVHRYVPLREAIQQYMGIEGRPNTASSATAPGAVGR